MPAIWGVILALATVILGRLAGFDRERSYYCVVLIVVGHYYDLFAVVGDRTALAQEIVGSLVFATAAVAGFRTSLWLVAVALAGHGLFDAFHARLVLDSGVPAWWPEFCAAFDVAAGLCLALLLRFGGVRARTTQENG